MERAQERKLSHKLGWTSACNTFAGAFAFCFVNALRNGSLAEAMACLVVLIVLVVVGCVIEGEIKEMLRG